MGYYIVKNGEYLTKNLKFSSTKEHGLLFDTKEDAEIFINFYNSTKEPNVTFKKDISDIDFNNIDISDICDRETKDILNEIDVISKKLILYSSCLSDDLSMLDQKINDIYHFIEFSNLNAVDGYKIYKKLQETLKQRRYTKNKLSDINNLISLINYSKIKDIKEQIELNENKKYNPRILTELFE